MERAPCYSASNGLIFSSGNHTVRTVEEAIEAAPHLITSAIEARTPFMATVCSTQLADLITAIRTARAQSAGLAAADNDHQPTERAA